VATIDPDRAGVDSAENTAEDGGSSPAFVLGARFGRFRITGILGAGGMGEVFEAEDTRLERMVALKVLPPARSTEPHDQARFEREARALAALNHPNIVTVHAVEEIDGRVFIVMERVRGAPLAAFIAPGGLDPDTFFRLALPLVDAVAAAHRSGIIHRDLKPSNVMVGDDGRLRVLDFGLAQARKEGGEFGTATTMTASGVVVGTAAYMSPEQAQGRSVDSRSDVFSLGVVLYEMATGSRPFGGESILDIAAAILRDPPPPFPRSRLLPTRVERIVMRCLEKDPTKRYQAAADLHWDLADVSKEASPRAKAYRLPRVIAVVGLVIASALAITVASKRWIGPKVPEGAPRVSTPRHTFRFSAPRTFSAGVISDKPNGCGLTDLDRDGKLDVVLTKMETSDAGDGAVAVLLGNGDGTFRAPVETIVGLHARQTVVADFDGDGHRDVATACSLAHRIDLLRGRGDGSVLPAKPIALAPVNKMLPYPEAVAAESFTMSGATDLVVAQAVAKSAVLLINRGDGEFAPAPSGPIHLGVIPRAIATADLDNDGRTDFMTANEDGSITQLMGLGDGTFLAPRNILVGERLAGLVLMKADPRTNFLSVVVTDPAANLVHVLVGKKDGRYSPPHGYPVGLGPYGLAAGDLDADGNGDLVVANGDEGTLSLLAGRGDGTFDDAQSLTVAPGPAYIAIGDLDGDGDLDVVVTQSRVNLVTVLLNEQK